ncbi:MAG: molecular chaperone TorD family protein [Spirochaetes bacterium]|nr:molecular chaperone TorD family protein [Spirochaetota bacterium]
MKQAQQDEKNIAGMSAKRGQIYQILINIFMCLPDEKFRNYLYSPEFQSFLERQKELQYPIITKGIGLITGFLKETMNVDIVEQIEVLAVDRTRLIRVPHATGLKAPYESQYQKEKKTSSSMLRITNLYRKAGFIPVDAKESVDFFCVELDFMRVLSEQIAKEPSKTSFLFSIQKTFLEEHLGKWIGEYAENATAYAETDFYRGCLMVLQGFIEIEKMYLKTF